MKTKLQDIWSKVIEKKNASQVSEKQMWKESKEK